MISTVIVGAGRIGNIRANAILKNGGKIASVADVDRARANQLAQLTEAEATTDWITAVTRPSVDAVIVCTPTKFHAQPTLAALSAGKHVLCEKPLGRTVGEAAKAAATAQTFGRVLKTGFNYRFMNHVRKAKELIDSGGIGATYFLRARYGHGGRPGYEKEWCTDADLSGGGVLLEQGIHLFDLARFLLEDPVSICAQTNRFFWQFPVVEDNAFCMMKFAGGQIAQIHISWTQWLNVFDLEIFGHDGFLRLEGRDGHYGPQKLTWGRRKPDHGRPELQVFEFPPQDDSWEREWQDFVSAIQQNEKTAHRGEDGLRAQTLIECAYRSAVENSWIAVPAECEVQRGAAG